MSLYKIAGLIVDVSGENALLERRGKTYLTDAGKVPDIQIATESRKIEGTSGLAPDMTPDEREYFLSSGQFYSKLLDFNGFLLHASAIEVGGRAYLFSAESGMGKSTHTRLWQKYLGAGKVRVINDDKPAVRLIDGTFLCCGTPWSGKSDLNLNIRVPLGSIVFLAQSPQNHIERLRGSGAIKLLFQNTIRPRNPVRLETLLALFDKLLKSVPVYAMRCNKDFSAAQLCCRTVMIKGDRTQ